MQSYPKAAGCRDGEEEVGEGTVQFIKASKNSLLKPQLFFFLLHQPRAMAWAWTIRPCRDRSLGASGEEMTSDKAGQPQRGLSADLLGIHHTQPAPLSFLSFNLQS